MPDANRLECTQSGDVTIVSFNDSKILDFTVIEEIDGELTHLVVEKNATKLLLNLRNVEFLSSAALNKLIVLEKRLRKIDGKIVLAELQPQVHEVFTITQLTKLFPICDRQADGLAQFN